MVGGSQQSLLLFGVLFIDPGVLSDFVLCFLRALISLWTWALDGAFSETPALGGICGTLHRRFTNGMFLWSWGWGWGG